MGGPGGQWPPQCLGWGGPGPPSFGVFASCSSRYMSGWYGIWAVCLPLTLPSLVNQPLFSCVRRKKTAGSRDTTLLWPPQSWRLSYSTASDFPLFGWHTNMRGHFLFLIATIRDGTAQLLQCLCSLVRGGIYWCWTRGWLVPLTAFFMKCIA